MNNDFANFTQTECFFGFSNFYCTTKLRTILYFILPYSYKFSRGQIFAHPGCAKSENFRADKFSRSPDFEKFRADLISRTPKRNIFPNFCSSFQ